MLEIFPKGLPWRDKQKNNISIHVLYAIVRNVLERIVDMGLMNQARIKVEDSV